jgi:uncharacterized phage protein (TIGR01671 family)
MREIKFRAWAGSEMLYGEEGDAWFFGADSSYISLIRPDNSPDDVVADNLENESFCIMQYTGLHDANGKEIYEGDILESMAGYRSRVEWWVNGWSDNTEKAYNRIVIGNIYENPELLDD